MAASYEICPAKSVVAFSRLAHLLNQRPVRVDCESGFLDENLWGLNLRRMSVMTTEESTFFRLLDGYARTRHQCFLAEMTFHNEERGYFLCFRPLGIRDDLIKKLQECSSENLEENVEDNLSALFASRYLTIPAQDVRAAGSLQQLPTSLIHQLDTELAKLKAGDDSVRGAEH